MIIPERLEALRNKMRERGIDVYIIPTADFHQSEYVGDHFKAREFITGFTGSAGTAVVTQTDARLWTDGRYFIQATRELAGSGFELMKIGESDYPTIEEYLNAVLFDGRVLGFDGRVVSVDEGQKYTRIAEKNDAVVRYNLKCSNAESTSTASKNARKLLITPDDGGFGCLDLVGDVWIDRPTMSTESAFALDIKYTGETTASKLARIRNVMADNDADLHAIATLDDLCWILNIRGNDIEYFPLVLMYGIISMDKMDLYIDEQKLSGLSVELSPDVQLEGDANTVSENQEFKTLKLKLESDGIVIHPYNQIYEDIAGIAADVGASSAASAAEYRVPGTAAVAATGAVTSAASVSIMIDPDRFNYALYQSIPDGVKKIEMMNPSVMMKASKNEVEIENIKQAQIKDSIAHIRFMKWLKENFGKVRMDELTVSDKLDEFRQKMGNYLRPSFDPISSYGEHCAIIHYSSTPETNVELQDGNFLLTDTGAGYLEGSTDITRTYAIGNVPQELKEHFTLVAISNLRLANAVFLEGCTGSNLDVLARQPMWERGLNYNHGTGHGVGYLMNIHEAPFNFRYKAPKDEPALIDGLVITDEPGIYVEGSHGIRLENELLCMRGTGRKKDSDNKLRSDSANTDSNTDDSRFMHFETLTFIPFDLDAINPAVMSDSDKTLLNGYHTQVYEKIAPYLNEDEQVWLKQYTRAI